MGKSVISVVYKIDTKKSLSKMKSRLNESDFFLNEVKSCGSSSRVYYLIFVTGKRLLMGKGKRRFRWPLSSFWKICGYFWIKDYSLLYFQSVGLIRFLELQSSYLCRIMRFKKQKSFYWDHHLKPNMFASLHITLWLNEWSKNIVLIVGA